jgi:pre-mRNA-splicing factor ISY1
MSRSEEKAKAALNRWRQLATGQGATESSELGRFPRKRHQLASECTSLTTCEQSRKELVEQITTKVEQIQRMVPDDNCKKLNDEINKLLKIKSHWERQIRALGGTDYRQKTERGSGGYMYFGAARELPEVKAYLKKAEAESLTFSLANQQVSPLSSSLLDHEYYGFDEADLLQREAEAEENSRRAALINDGSNSASSSVVVHWDERWKIPTPNDVENALLEYRKLALIKKYAS